MKEVNRVLKEQIKLVRPSEEEFNEINKIKNSFVKELNGRIKKQNIKATVFIGGSLAKNTLVKKDIYDVDVFVRFDSSNKNISSLLSKLVKGKKVHGSRDYFNIKKGNIIIEIIPVLKINKPEQAVNVTDLSYFHVNYILRKMKSNKNLADEIRLAKTFTHAQNAYGAESYIHGFSGYALELLICHYKTFLNFIKSIAKLDIKKEKLVIDDQKYYKNKDDLLYNFNKSKIYGPIVLIDPTFKERNALSSLTKETLYEFQNVCRSFLKKPNKSFFVKQPVSKKFKNPTIITVRTTKQAGDIAGTKSKKFYEFFLSRLKEEFEVNKSDFEYDEEENIAKFYLKLSKKKTSIVKGPPITAVNNLASFKKANPKAFIKKGFAYKKLVHDLKFDRWFSNFLKNDKKIIKEMDILVIN